ncbi:hypothetical protein ACFFMN_42470 [Planobispora siamensis]|uniref:Secreted protein n=1 Tax=Planobispora siamensis TaxID=936338 RepID=A0A8J3WNK3_9ACTN|nr:hypothetical protein [Planobispora siamensis]GIH97519.1 hypothetical protein Psi01_81490 [Planobispora siamensis]
MIRRIIAASALACLAVAGTAAVASAADSAPDYGQSMAETPIGGLLSGSGGLLGGGNPIGGLLGGLLSALKAG